MRRRNQPREAASKSRQKTSGRGKQEFSAGDGGKPFGKGTEELVIMPSFSRVPWQRCINTRSFDVSRCLSQVITNCKYHRYCSSILRDKGN